MTKTKLDRKLMLLYRRWDKLEKDIISDEDLIKAAEKALKTLDLIFDRGAPEDEEKFVDLFNDFITKHHGTEKTLQGLLALEKDIAHGKLIGETHAIFESGKKTMSVHRSALMYRFLVNQRKGENIKLLTGINRLAEAVKTPHTGASIEGSGIHRDKQFMVELIEVYLDLLEKEKDYLKRHRRKLSHDLTQEFSAASIILHEMTHNIWALIHYFEQMLTMRWKLGINEAWAHVINVIGNIYHHKGKITASLIREEIQQIQQMVEFKSTVGAYNEPVEERFVMGEKKHFSTTHDSLQPAMYLIGAALLTDYILRKNQGERIMGGLKNHFSRNDLTRIHDFVMDNVKKIEDQELRELIEKELILKASVDNQKTIDLLIKKVEFVLSKSDKWMISNLSAYYEMVIVRCTQILILGRKKEARHLMEEFKDKLNEFFSSLKNKTEEITTQHQQIMERIDQAISDEDKRARQLNKLVKKHSA